MIFKRRTAAPATIVHPVTLRPSGLVLDVRADQTILERALELGLPFPHQCKAALCASCRCQLLDGEVAARKPMAKALGVQRLGQGWILACQCEPRSVVTLHIESRGNRDMAAPSAD